MFYYLFVAIEFMLEEITGSVLIQHQLRQDRVNLCLQFIRPDHYGRNPGLEGNWSGSKVSLFTRIIFIPTKEMSFSTTVAHYS